MASKKKTTKAPPRRSDESKPSPRPRGRPKIGKGTRSIHVSIPVEIADWLDQQENKSAVVTEALRVAMSSSAPRR